VKLRNWKRPSWSSACVTEGSRTSDTFVTEAASGVCTVKPCPYRTIDGALVIVGLAPLNRYGGE
jgi:hypothetical protein